MRRIAVWRHGRTSWNAEQRFQGQTDIPLDDVGVFQARRAAAMLASLPPTSIICSDLMRTRQTAEPLIELTGITPHVDEGLRETFAGEWEGKTRSVLLADYGDDLSRWSFDPHMRAGATGETRLEVADRFVAAVDRALPDLPGRVHASRGNSHPSMGAVRAERSAGRGASCAPPRRCA